MLQVLASFCTESSNLGLELVELKLNQDRQALIVSSRTQVLMTTSCTHSWHRKPQKMDKGPGSFQIPGGMDKEFVTAIMGMTELLGGNPQNFMDGLMVSSVEKLESSVKDLKHMGVIYKSLDQATTSLLKKVDSLSDGEKAAVEHAQQLLFTGKLALACLSGSLSVCLLLLLLLLLSFLFDSRLQMIESNLI